MGIDIPHIIALKASVLANPGQPIAVKTHLEIEIRLRLETLGLDIKAEVLETFPLITCRFTKR
jgi:hypothetical protein